MSRGNSLIVNAPPQLMPGLQTNPNRTTNITYHISEDNQKIPSATSARSPPTAEASCDAAISAALASAAKFVSAACCPPFATPSDAALLPSLGPPGKPPETVAQRVLSEPGP